MSKQNARRKEGFTWGIKTTDIAFMRRSPGEAVLEGSTTGCDCGAITKFDVRKPARQGRRKSG